MSDARRLLFLCNLLLLAAAAAGLTLFFVLVGAATTARAGAERALASAYGPGLYGNALACGGRLWPHTRAIAHRSLPCGTMLRLCYRRRCTRARVLDRGPFVDGRTLDLSEAVVRRLGVRSASAWGVRSIRYRPARR